MRYLVLANLVVLLHSAFIVFVVGGALLLLHSRWWALLHIPAFAWGALIEFKGWICPLTPLENALRAKAGQGGYAGGFIEHYLTRLIYPAGLTPRIQVAIGAFVLALNALLYWWILRRVKGGP
jgi:Protein of Unknown function (DUF2784)